MSTHEITRTTIGWADTCPAIGEHTGDPYTVDTDDTRWQKWSCCDTAEPLGELFWCEGCTTRGVAPTGTHTPPRWIEHYHHGFLCPDCQRTHP